MNEEEKYKLALFAVIRNSSIAPTGEKYRKTREEINAMTRKTMDVVLEMCDFAKLKRDYEER